MLREETISAGQMSCLFLCFMTGSSIINLPQPLVQAANSGAWLSVSIANGFGMLLLLCILYLYGKNPNFTLIDYSRQILGQRITICIFIPILIFLFLVLSYVVIDIGGFFTTAMMRETPSYVFHTLILLVAALTVRAGIEVMVRMFVLLLSYMFLFLVVVLALTFPHYKAENLLPVLPEGMGPVIQGTYMLIGFPYGELILFSFLLPFVRNEKGNSLKKSMFVALFTHGFLLIISILCTIMALGPLAGKLKFSIFQLARLINIRDIITRIESFVGIALMVGSYMKVTILLLILKETLARVFKLKDDRIIIFPVTFISLLLTLTMFKTEIEFMEAAFVILPLLSTVILVFPLLFITLVTTFKGKNRTNDG